MPLQASEIHEIIIRSLFCQSRPSLIEIIGNRLLTNPHNFPETFNYFSKKDQVLHTYITRKQVFL